ncbi:hypothetical protein BCON_0223g00150 [Botryotinia convoluta]|uniref:Uncharacterized protein n=1 Tax=Botryotinia convoluta TaxID=54673 RepID=A0A4Z1HJB3_9HELO|nr:hypothetical protein BCON_0223g00150 [Botryotinia convoluta]
MPGIVERKTERSVNGRIGEKEVDPMKLADEGVQRPEVGGDTGSPERILSMGEGRAEGSRSKDQEPQENKTVSGYVRRHGGSETRNKQERRYPERVGVGDIKVGTKRGRPSTVEGRRPGGGDTERRGGRKQRKRIGWRVFLIGLKG